MRLRRLWSARVPCTGPARIEPGPISTPAGWDRGFQSPLDILTRRLAGRKPLTLWHAAGIPMHTAARPGARLPQEKGVGHRTVTEPRSVARDWGNRHRLICVKAGVHYRP
jgi:hypothetical protein